MRHPTLLDRRKAILVVIDVQERLLEVYRQRYARQVIQRTAMLIKGAQLFDLPIVATEQYPKGIGPTQAAIRSLFPQDTAPIVKNTMSCFGCPEFVDTLNHTNRKQVILCGIETHVCVLQTALDLLADGAQVHLCTDATGCRRSEDYKTAIDRMGQAGIVLTTAESALFQLLEDSSDARLKSLLEIVR